jgi:hypothetical protein
VLPGGVWAAHQYHTGSSRQPFPAQAMLQAWSQLTQVRPEIRHCGDVTRADYPIHTPDPERPPVTGWYMATQIGVRANNLLLGSSCVVPG